MALEFAVLGPLVIRRGDAPVAIGSRRQRALLIHLLLRAGQTVPVDRLIDALWDDDPPPQARVTLRSYVSNLRRVLHGPGEPELILTRSSGYMAQVDEERIDAVRFERGVAAARERMGAGDPQAALEHLDDALRLWRGQALADLGDTQAARGERTRLDELRLAAEEDRFDVLLALGRHVEAVAALEAFTAREPLRERARAQLMLALYRSGRAPDALKAFQQLREALVEELGLDPSPQLQHLADQILQQAPDLDAPTAPEPRAAPPPSTVADVATPLVGRAHERAELLLAVTRVTAGVGGLMLVTGEPGIGKTALLEELERLAGAADTTVSVYWGRCHETQGAPAFWPWMQILRRVAADQDDATLEELVAGAGAAVGLIADEIPQRTGRVPPPVGDDIEGARFQLYDAIATFLLGVAARGPLVLLIDDLHWADTATLQALAFLTPALAGGSILVAATYRNVEADWSPDLGGTLATVVREPSTQQLELTGLHPEDVGRLAEKLTGRAGGTGDVESLHGRTGGNPFFVRQLSQLLADAEAGGDGGVAIPSGVRHVLARRLGMLPAAVTEMLEVAAVVGRDFDVRLLARATGSSVDAALDAASAARAHGLLEEAARPATGFRFVHALVRETLYDAVPVHRRARLHKLVGEALEAQPRSEPAEVAEHFWMAADLVDDDRPVRHLVAAAEQSLQVLGFEQAESHLQRALKLLVERGDDPAGELVVRAKLVQLFITTRGWASPAIHEVAAPTRRLTAAAGLCPEAVALWSAVLGYHMACGDAAAAQAVAQELLDAGTAAGDAAVLAAGHSALAYIDISLGRDPARALDQLAQAREHLRDVPPEQLREPPHVGVQITGFEAGALAMQGEADRARATARRGIAEAEEIGDPFRVVHALTNAALVGVLVEDPAFAAEVSARGLALCRQHGLRMSRLPLEGPNSWARARLGEDPAEQAEQMWEAMQAAIAAGQPGPRGKSLLFTAETYLLAGDVESAARCLQQAREVADQLGEHLPARRVDRLEREVTRTSKAT